MLDCKPIDNPMDPNIKLVRTSEVTTNKERFKQLVGRLIYITHTERDIGFSVSAIGRFMNNPSKAHMEVVRRILQYLKFFP